MLATYITYLLCYLHEERNYNIHVIVLCRTRSKAEDLFLPFLKETWFSLFCQDICDPIHCPTSVDYIFILQEMQVLILSRMILLALLKVTY